MRRSQHRMLMVLLSAVLAFFALTPNASATTGGDLGGMELNEYCQSFGFQGASVSNNGQSNPWVCYSGSNFSPLDLFGACLWQFNDLGVRGFNVRYVGNGRCWALNTTDYSSPSDLKKIGDYCRSLGYSNAVITTTNVAGWRCIDSSRVVHPLDLHAACRWVNSG